MLHDNYMSWQCNILEMLFKQMLQKGRMLLSMFRIFYKNIYIFQSFLVIEIETLLEITSRIQVSIIINPSINFALICLELHLFFIELDVALADMFHCKYMVHYYHQGKCTAAHNGVEAKLCSKNKIYIALPRRNWIKRRQYRDQGWVWVKVHWRKQVTFVFSTRKTVTPSLTNTVLEIGRNNTANCELNANVNPGVTSFTHSNALCNY